MLFSERALGRLPAQLELASVVLPHTQRRPTDGGHPRAGGGEVGRRGRSGHTAGLVTVVSRGVEDADALGGGLDLDVDLRLDDAVVQGLPAVAVGVGDDVRAAVDDDAVERGVQRLAVVGRSDVEDVRRPGPWCARPRGRAAPRRPSRTGRTSSSSGGCRCRARPARSASAPAGRGASRVAGQVGGGRRGGEGVDDRHGDPAAVVARPRSLGPTPYAPCSCFPAYPQGAYALGFVGRSGAVRGGRHRSRRRGTPHLGRSSRSSRRSTAGRPGSRLAAGRSRSDGPGPSSRRARSRPRRCARLLGTASGVSLAAQLLALHGVVGEGGPERRGGLSHRAGQASTYLRLSGT